MDAQLHPSFHLPYFFPSSFHFRTTKQKLASMTFTSGLPASEDQKIILSGNQDSF